MKKFKIEKQQLVYAANERNLPQINSLEIECDSCKFVRNETIITSDNIERAREFFGNNYNINDVFVGPLEEVVFIKDDLEINSFNVLADPYYKLYEFINEEWVLIDKHSCC